MIVYALNQEKFKRKDILTVTGLPESTYHYHCSKQDTKNKDEDLEHLIQEIFNEHDGNYGYRRIQKALKNKEHLANHKRFPSRNLRYEKGHENLFAELVFCGTCGHKFYYSAFEKNGHNLDHYKCSRYAKTVDHCDTPHYIRKSELIEMVLADIN